MRIVKRIGLGLLALLMALVILVVGAVVVDALLDRGRIDALTNSQIANPNGVPVRAFIAQPAGPGPHPAVIMIHEFWGMSADTNSKAAALAQEGYVVVAPDTYRGAVANWIPRAIYQVLTTPDEKVNADLDTVFTWLATQPNVDPERIAVMGFCYGGGKSLVYSLHNNRLAATGIFYGTLMADAEKLRALPGPVLGIFGGADSSIPVSEVKAFEAALNTAGIQSQITIYDGEPHAFVKNSAQIQQGGKAGEAWAEFVAFLKANL